MSFRLGKPPGRLDAVPVKAGSGAFVAAGLEVVTRTIAVEQDWYQFGSAHMTTLDRDVHLQETVIWFTEVTN